MSLAKDIKQEFLRLRAHRTFHKLSPENYHQIRKGTVLSIAQVLYNQNRSLPKIALSPKIARELQKALDRLKKTGHPPKKKVPVIF